MKSHLESFLPGNMCTRDHNKGCASLFVITKSIQRPLLVKLSGGGVKRGLNETTGVAVKKETFETKVSNVNR